VTVEDIADQAGVSPRTFFNYFGCKEEAIVGADPTLLAIMAERVAARPEDEEPVAALLGVLTEGDESDLVERWTTRARLVAGNPELIPQYVAGVFAMERALTGAIAIRMGVDPVKDPHPRLVVAAAVAALRSTFEWWEANGRPRPLVDALRDAFDGLSSGLSGGTA